MLPLHITYVLLCKYYARSVIITSREWISRDNVYNRREVSCDLYTNTLPFFLRSRVKNGFPCPGSPATRMRRAQTGRVLYMSWRVNAKTGRRRCCGVPPTSRFSSDAPRTRHRRDTWYPVLVSAHSLRRRLPADVAASETSRSPTNPFVKR